MSALVMLTLTGFSTTGGKSKSGGSKSSGGGGGGCSSSKQDHDSSSSSGGYNTRPTNAAPTPTATGSSAAPLKDGVARVVSCASAKQPYAVVEVRNPNRSSADFTVGVEFREASGWNLDVGTDTIRVPGRQTKTVQLPLDSTHLTTLDRCVLTQDRPDAVA
ncbi:hypothetical protein ABZX42_41150 [Streptomyces sp. NPDC004611]|uniref:hypothetical protein n=1 Tax=Streptomyces sp. NPDC004611 TaxID=3154669 RepID=UPI0033B4ED55